VLFRSATAFPADDHRAFNREGAGFDRGETFSGVDYETGLETVERLRPLVPPGATLAQFALKWILSFEAVSCVIPGARRTIHGPRRPRIRSRRKGDGKRRAAPVLGSKKSPHKAGSSVGLAGWRSERHQDHHHGVPDGNTDENADHGFSNIGLAHAATSATLRLAISSRMACIVSTIRTTRRVLCVCRWHAASSHASRRE
jgi:hypothetical protein